MRSGRCMPVTPIELFLRDIDANWPPSGSKIPLKVLGSTALMLQTPYIRGTKDSDVLGVDPVHGAVADGLLELAGKGTKLHLKHQVYIDIVGSGIPFLPHPTIWHPAHELNKSLQSFEVNLLDITDVVVSKLKRFNGPDRDDIRAMVDLELIDHVVLIERFLSAAEVFCMDSRACNIPVYAKNLNWIEREYLGVAETDYELPPWADA